MFTEVQENLLFIVHEVVEASGSAFAFPSTTAYLTDDAGLPAMRPSAAAGAGISDQALH